MYNNLYEDFIKFENDLFYAEELNVNKNDIIDNYLKSFNFWYEKLLYYYTNLLC